MPQSRFNTPCDESSVQNENNVVVNDQKFAALTAALNDILIDDETSPSDSLISSTTSDDLSSKNKFKKNMIETIKDSGEKDINDVSPIFEVASPISHGTPTHATNSFSFSDGDGGRDFLIDDEIADQPVLCFGDNQGNPNDSFAYHSLSASRFPVSITPNILLLSLFFIYQHQAHNCIRLLIRQR